MKRIITVISLMVAVSVSHAVPVYAADPPEPPKVDVFKQVCSTTNDSTACQDRSKVVNGDGEVQNPIYGPEGILTTLINLLSLIAGIAAVIIIIMSGLRFVTSGTNPQDVSNARERIIYAAAGLVVVAIAQAIVRFVLGKTGLI